ncbi:MAG: hypothetical protein MUC62_04870 [Candidatus Thermoplasmatota archaeon]|jgi:hypothetical protein|nr:hypothetical protein [Candidatus Thermoplasmatota archaeon]
MGIMKILGGVVVSLAAIAVVVILCMTLILPAGSLIFGAKSAEKEFDSWARTAKQGDEITVSGRLDEKDHTQLLGQDIYSYRFKGCRDSFMSSEDIGNKGDLVIVTITHTGIIEASASIKPIVAFSPNICCGVFSAIFLIGGLVILLIGLKKDKKEKELKDKEEAEKIAQLQKRVIPPPSFIHGAQQPSAMATPLTQQPQAPPGQPPK